MDGTLKELFWLGSSHKDLSAFPEDVKDVFGFALFQAQIGGKHPAAKPLTGFKGSGVLEIVDDYDGDTYRAAYTVKFEGVVYCLHAFQKKSKTGKKTSKSDIDLIKSRLKLAEDDFKERKKGTSHGKASDKGKR